MQYFIPGVQSVGKTTIAEAGLSDRLTHISHRQCTRGPDGHAGILIAEGEQIPKMTDNHIWHPAPHTAGEKPVYYFGWDAGEEIGPQQLARPEQLSGKHVTLLDGNRWLVPQLREWREGEADEAPITYRCRLPRRYGMTPDGKLCHGDVLPRYKELWRAGVAEGDRVYSELVKETRVSVSLVDQAEFVGRLLAVNYRVTLFELVTLGLLCDRTAAEVYSVGLDLTAMQETLGNVLRRLSGGNATSSGDEPSTQASSTRTAPQSAS